MMMQRCSCGISGPARSGKYQKSHEARLGLVRFSSSFANPLRPGFISDLVFSLFLLFIPIKHPFALKGCSVLSSTSVQIRGRGRSNNVLSHPATSCTKNGGGKGTRSPSIPAGKTKSISLLQCGRINPPPQPCSSSDPAFIRQGKCGMPQKLPH